MPNARFFAVSDLHLHDDPQPFLFTDQKQAIFVSLAEEALTSGATLLLAGDVLDLTGMNPPRQGLFEFFKQVLPATALEHPEVIAAMKWRELDEQFAAVRVRFPAFFESLGKLARDRRLLIIPGNHDCALGSAKGMALFAQAVGCRTEEVRWEREFASGDFFFAVHGNEFDLANLTRKGCENPGSAITAALYRAVMPALRVLGVPHEAVAAIPAVRPEEETVRAIQRFLGEEKARVFLFAFVRLLVSNGYFRGPRRWGLTLLTRQVPGITRLAQKFITPDKVRAAMPDDTDLKLNARQGAERIRHGKKIVVMGHTHELDWLPDYVNLGTWIDHITGFSPEHLARAECALPVLRVMDDDSADLIDAREMKEGGSLAACHPLWTYRSTVS
jgi:UDP-2,3-diacylglucosamine pyrophosphatase LpxH